MGKVNDAFLEQIENLGRRSLYSAEVLLDAWNDWWDNGYRLLTDQVSDPQYNNCFTLGGKAMMGGRLIKIPMYISEWGNLCKLWGGKDGHLQEYYAQSYEEARQMLTGYLQDHQGDSKNDSLRVSLYLDNAMYGNLHLFVLDFDRFDTESSFFKGAMAIADKVTRSQGGGYHMFFGINKWTATPLFDSINLLASGKAKSYVCSTGKVTLDGANKVDLFCDARQFIYEWEEWDNTVGLTDRTKELYALIRDNFSLKRQKDTLCRGTDELHLKEIEELSYRTGYPPNILLEIWLEQVEDAEDAEDEPDWEYFKQGTLELDW